MRVLVVDDDEETRRLLVRNLQLASHGVKAVESCAPARDALAHDRFDVVVLDVMLPDGSGIELCSWEGVARCAAIAPSRSVR